MEDYPETVEYNLPQKGNEKLLAAIAHFAVFFLPVLLPFVIWYLEEHKENFSEYVLFQSKQALLYQLFIIVVLFGLGVFLMVFSYFLVGLLFLPTFVGLLFLAFGYAAYGGLQCLMGKNFRYYFIGEKVQELRI